MATQRMRPERRIAIIREVVLLIVGIAGITHQTLIGPVNLPLLLAFIAMTGIPGFTNVLTMISNSSNVLQSSSSPQQGLDGDSENSSTASSPAGDR